MKTESVLIKEEECCMAAKIISGAEIASAIREEIKAEAVKLKEEHNIASD